MKKFNLSQKASTALSVVPLFVLMGLLALCVSLLGSDSILGASQVALLVSAGVCISIGSFFFGIPWETFEESVSSNIKNISTALLVLIMVGAVSGTWMMSGIIPSFIYYGVQIISPRLFLPTACIISAIVSLMVGSSWTTIATIGVALLGIGHAEGINDAISAGAIISGAYFGDKMSPLSDTTVMSSYVVGVPLFEHIKYLMFTTVPAIVIALVLYTVIGIAHTGATPEEIKIYSTAIKETFNLSPFLLIVPVFTGWMIYKKKPALFVLGLSSLLACISAVILQPEIIKTLGEQVTGTRLGVGTIFTGAIRTIYDGTEIDTGISEVNSLISSRGMLGMLNTVFLIICAMAFGASMKAGGMITRIAAILLPLTKTRGGLVASTVATGFCINGIAADQFLSIIITSDIYKDIYKKEGYEPRLLSRSVEDSATVTSPLIPWSTCGMTQATILGIPTFIYAPFSFFNWLSPLMSILIASIGYKIVRRKPEHEVVA